MTYRKIKKIVDGDSGYFANGQRFRLKGVRAPEFWQKKSSTAKKSFAGMLSRSNNNVKVKSYAKDKFGRLIVDLFNKDGNINSRLQKRGFKNLGR